MNYTPLEVAIALSLYSYNVSPVDRAQKVYAHFDGDCAELRDLVRVMDGALGPIPTTLAYPSAVVYVAHAMERYGEEARQRVEAEDQARFAQ